jgi:hypothetical protein
MTAELNDVCVLVSKLDAALCWLGVVASLALFLLVLMVDDSIVFIASFVWVVSVIS